ncbi:MAG: MFS transporter [Clostridia bacterium]|nr:MFS transporter [Clostridia bacterium]
MAFLQGMVFYCAIATLYRQAAGISMVEMALIESASLALSFVLEVPWGMAADRLGYRRTMILCSALFALSKVIFWQAKGFAMFLTERLLLSVVTSGLSGVDESILYLSCPKEKALRIFGLWNALGNAGLLMASLIYSLFIGEDYRLAALLTVIAYAMAAVLSLFLREVKPGDPSSRPALSFLRTSLRQIRSVRGLLPLVMAGALLGEAVHYATVFLSQLQYIRCGLDSSTIGLCFTLSTAMALAGPLSAPLTARLGKRRTGLLLMAGCSLCCILLAGSTSAWLSILCMMALEAACALYNPLHAALENDLIRTDDRATALSCNALLSGGIGVMANMGFGGAADASLPLALMACALLCLAGTGCYAASTR